MLLASRCGRVAGADWARRGSHSSATLPGADKRRPLVDDMDDRCWRHSCVEQTLMSLANRRLLSRSLLTHSILMPTRSHTPTSHGWLTGPTVDKASAHGREEGRPLTQRPRPRSQTDSGHGSISTGMPTALPLRRHLILHLDATPSRPPPPSRQCFLAARPLVAMLAARVAPVPISPTHGD